MQGKIFIPLLLALLAGAYSCSTDIELNAPYESRTVVYGLLEPQLDTQWVKVNRTWLGDGNNLEIAMISDSSEYQPGDFTGKIEEWSGGSLVQSYTLYDTLLENKSTDGIFFAPEHRAYYCVTPSGLNSSSLYRLNLDFENKEDVEATTDIIAEQPGSISFPPSLATFELAWANVSGFTTTYNNQTFEWNSTNNAKRYEARLRIHIVENVWEDEAHTILAESRPVTLEWFIGTRSTNDADGGESLDVEVSGSSFYQFLASKLDADPMITREFGIWDAEEQFTRAIDFVLTIANEELDTYLDINEPVTNIVQERPNYTNVTNGLGIFASRSQNMVTGVGITTNSLKALVEGEYTADLNFCTPNPFSDYYCEN